MRVVLALALTVLAGMVHAAPATWECIVRPITYATDMFGPFDNPIQPRMQFVIDPAAGTATVSDALIRGMNGTPMPARITLDNDTKITMVWDMFLNGRTLAQAKMSFRAAYMKNRNLLLLTARPMGYEQLFHGRGNCVELG